MTNSMLFEGADLEEVLAEARLCLGAELEIEAANRVRRGGLLGFFATEWYEVWARAADAHLDPALALLELEDLGEPDSFQAMVRNALVDRETHDEDGPPARFEDAMDQFFGGDTPADPYKELAPVPGPAADAAEMTQMPAPTSPTTTPVAAPNGHAAAAAPAVGTGTATMIAPDVVPASVALEDPPRGSSVFEAERAPRTDLLWAMLDRLDAAPAAPSLPAGSGLVVFVGDAESALETVRRIGNRTGRWNGDVPIVTRRSEIEGVPSWLLVTALEDLAARADRWRQRDGLVPVVLDHGLDAADRSWAAQAVLQTSPDQVRLVTEAWRLPHDVGRLAGKIGGADALELIGVSDSVEPLAMLDLDIPVGSIEGRDATPELLAAVWLENRRRA